MKYRLIDKRDDARVAFIIRECLTEYGGDHRPDTAWADPYLDRFSEVYVLDNNRYWVAETEDGTVVAGIGVGPICGAPGIGELQKMYCLEPFRGRGVAEALLQLALNFAKAHYDALYLETMDNMLRAQRFYEKNGFVKTEETIGNTGHTGCGCHYILWFSVPEAKMLDQP